MGGGHSQIFEISGRGKFEIYDIGQDSYERHPKLIDMCIIRIIQHVIFLY